MSLKANRFYFHVVKTPYQKNNPAELCWHTHLLFVFFCRLQSISCIKLTLGWKSPQTFLSQRTDFRGKAAASQEGNAAEVSTEWSLLQVFLPYMAAETQLNSILPSCGRVRSFSSDNHYLNVIFISSLRNLYLLLPL